MKRGVYLVIMGMLITAVSLTFTVSGCASKPAAPEAPAPAPAEVYTLKYYGILPAEGMVAENKDSYFMNKVEELSKGRIKWEYFPAQQLGPATQVLDIIGGGGADAGFVIPAFLTGKVPAFGVQDFPFLVKTDDFAEHQRIIIDLMHQPPHTDAYAQFNIKLLFVDVQGKMCFFTKFPLKKLEDFKGKKVRTAGKAAAAGMKALGGEPQSMVQSEVYLALQTGVVDGAAMNTLQSLFMKWYEVTQYLLVPAISATGFGGNTVLNIDTFNKLPKDLQDAILKAAKDSEDYCQKKFFELDKWAAEELASKGMDVYNLPMEEALRWREAVEPLWDTWLAEMGEPSQKQFDFVLKKVGEK